LKCLAPGDGDEILPVIDLWLINDKRSARLDDLARPSGILGRGRWGERHKYKRDSGYGNDVC
jgi:hypothetical protein